MRRFLWPAVLFSRHPTVFLSLFTLLLSSLTSCANSPVSQNLEKSFAADPKLKDNPAILGQPVAQRNPQNTTLVDLPSDFPSEIPRYPSARLQQVISGSNGSDSQSSQAEQGTETRWKSPDSAEAIQSFYQQQFQDSSWQILSQPNPQNPNVLEARQNNLKVRVSIQPDQNTTPSANQTPGTGFTIQYVRESSQTAEQPTGEATAIPPQAANSGTPTSAAEVTTPTATPSPEVTTPTPQASPTNTPDTSVASTSTVFSDINKTPEELRSYVSELAQLGVLNVTPSASKTDGTSTEFQPNKIITRREFARWLIATKNRLESTQPAKQIRLATASSQPAFQDVPKSDPDFGAIQGLAEAGIIPSTLSGDNTALLFRPDAPLTREQMMIWKVPLDTRLTTSGATFEAVKQTWAFQDTFKIDPKAIKAMLTDYQLADTSNIRRVFGYTTLFQPKKPVTRAEAAATLWHFGTQSEGISAKEVLKVKSQ